MRVLDVYSGVSIREKRALAAIALLVIIMFIIGSPLMSLILRVYGEGQTCGTATGIAVHEYKGIPLKVTVCISKGDGVLVIEGVSYDELVAYSLKESVYMAAWSLGLDPWSLNYVVKIEPADPAVNAISGTSLSLTTYVAAIAALKEVNIVPYAITTGTLNPDLTVGFVGQVEYKARGAQEWNFTLLLYPLLQSNKYVIKNIVKHFGPYAFETKTVSVSPVNFTGISIRLEEVGWGPEACLILAGLDEPSLNITLDDLLDASGSYLDRNTTVLQRLTDYILDKTLEYLSKANNTLAWSVKSMLDPWIRSYAYTLIINATKAYSASMELLNRRAEAAALEYMLYAYEKAVNAYYFLALTHDSEEAITEARIDLTRTKALAESILERIARIASVYSIPALAEASVSYSKALKLHKQAEFDLGVIAINGYGDRALAYTASRNLAKALAEYTRTIILTGYAEKTLRGPHANLSRLASEIMDYAKHLYLYTRALVYNTGVSSELVTMAGSNWWLARMHWMKSGNSTLGKLTVIGYSLRSIVYSSLYMALHPGFEGVAEARYPYILATLEMLSNITGYEPMIAYELQLASMYDDVTDKIYHLERAIAYAKLLILALRNTIHIQEESLEGWGTPLKPSARGHPDRVSLGLLVSGTIAAAFYAILAKQPSKRGRTPRIPFLSMIKNIRYRLKT